MSRRPIWHVWPGLAAGLSLCLAAGELRAQADDPAPYLHTHVHQKTRAAPIHPPKTKHVPVVAPRRAGPPRHAGHATGSRTAGAKPLIAAPAKKTVPSKPEPPPEPANVGSNTKLPLPRYASLKSDDVNMRTGPGERYPVLWTYQRRDLPVKIEREFDIWRYVEDMDGIKGWVQAGFLAGHRSFVITGTDDRTLRADGSDTADAVAILKPGVVGRIRACDAAKDWCEVQVQGYRGWLRRTDMWGVDQGEAITP